jgi:hypothetical protein
MVSVEAMQLEQGALLTFTLRPLTVVDPQMLLLLLLLLLLLGMPELKLALKAYAPI